MICLQFLWNLGDGKWILCLSWRVWIICVLNDLGFQIQIITSNWDRHEAYKMSLTLQWYRKALGQGYVWHQRKEAAVCQSGGLRRACILWKDHVWFGEVSVPVPLTRMHWKENRLRLRGHHRSLCKTRPCNGLDSIAPPLGEKMKRDNKTKEKNKNNTKQKTQKETTMVVIK